MNTAQLAVDLALLGIRLEADGEGELTIDGPTDMLTPDLIQRLKNYKRELLAAFRLTAQVFASGICITAIFNRAFEYPAYRSRFICFRVWYGKLTKTQTIKHR